jgi:hypothetical protein
MGRVVEPISRSTMKEPLVINHIQRRMIGHAAFILLVGMFAGVGLLISRLGGLEVWPGTIFPIQLPGSADAWVRTHIGGMLNAFLIMIVALVLPIVHFDEAGSRRMSWMLVGTGWANTLFYWAAIVAPNRALTFGDNQFGGTSIAAIVGLAPALVFTVISIVAVAQLARQALR